MHLLSPSPPPDLCPLLLLSVLNPDFCILKHLEVYLLLTPDSL